MVSTNRDFPEVLAVPISSDNRGSTVIGRQKIAKGTKRRPNLCPPHETIVAMPMYNPDICSQEAILFAYWDNFLDKSTDTQKMTPKLFSNSYLYLST